MKGALKQALMILFYSAKPKAQVVYLPANCAQDLQVEVLYKATPGKCLWVLCVRIPAKYGYIGIFGKILGASKYGVHLEMKDNKNIYFYLFINCDSEGHNV